MREFGVPGPDSSLLGRADSSAAPAMDILGAVRGGKPDIGAVQRDGVLSALQVRLFPGHVFSGGKSLVNRVVLKEPRRFRSRGKARGPRTSGGFSGTGFHSRG